MYFLRSLSLQSHSEITQAEAQWQREQLKHKKAEATLAADTHHMHRQQIAKLNKNYFF